MIAVLLLALCSLVPQGDPGGAAFRAGRPAQALEHYRDALARTGAPSATLLFNLGSTAAGLGRHGEALWYLERARRQAPRDARVLHNLAHVRRALDRDAPTGVLARVAALPRAFSPWELTWLTVALQAGGLIGLVLLGGHAAARRCALLLALLGLAAGTTVVAQRWLLPPTAVVLRDAEPVRRAPHAELPSLARLPEGSEVRVLEASDRWARVRHDGGEGFVARAALGLLDP